MFEGCLTRIHSGMVTIPLAQMADDAQNITMAVGVGVPIYEIPRLGGENMIKDHLFDFKKVEQFAKSILEPHGPTLTGQWMDAVGPFKHLYPQGIAKGWHRTMHGHFIGDVLTVMKDPRLSCVDFFAHLGTDVVTKNGLPILPSSISEKIVALLNTYYPSLGMTATKLSFWVNLNILDAAASILAVAHAASSVIDVVTGSAQWGAGYAINTFGVGACEIASGVASKNPILVGSGCVDIVCGTATAYDYYSQPFLCGVPVVDILQSSTLGACVATLLTGIELYTQRGKISSWESVKTLAKRITQGGLMSALSVISAPVAITTAIGISGAKLAVQQVNDLETSIRAMPLTGAFARHVNDYVIDAYIGRDKYKSMEKKLERFYGLR